MDLPQIVDVKLCLYQTKVNGRKWSDFVGLGRKYSPRYGFSEFLAKMWVGDPKLYACNCTARSQLSVRLQKLSSSWTSVNIFTSYYAFHLAPVSVQLVPFPCNVKTRMHSSRMRTARSLTVSRSICHTRPPPCMPPAMLTSLPCMPPAMHAPLPCMPPCHAHPTCHVCPFAMHAPPAMPAPHARPTCG